MGAWEGARTLLRACLRPMCVLGQDPSLLWAGEEEASEAFPAPKLPEFPQPPWSKNW